MSTSSQDFNAQVIDEFRANQGRVGGMFEGMPILLLHHFGARSGEARVSPLSYLSDNDRYVIFASKGGAPVNPGWYYNLKAHPEVEIEVGSESMDVTAGEVTGEEREPLWAEQVRRRPNFGEYQEKSERVIPVIVLTPRQTA